MKRLTTIFFLFLYFAFTVGITEAIHFCDGKITNVRILPVASQEYPCGCDDAMTPDDCCKTEIKTVQLNDEQIAVKVDQPSSSQTDLSLWADKPNEPLYSSNVLHAILPADSPPGLPPLYILNSVFLI